MRITTFIFLLFGLLLTPVFGQNPAPYSVQAAPVPKLVTPPTPLLSSDSHGGSFYFIGPIDGGFAIYYHDYVEKDKKEGDAKSSYNLYTVEIFDRNFKQKIREFKVNFKSIELISIEIFAINNKIHFLYTIKETPSKVVLCKDIYDTQGNAEVKGIKLDEMNIINKKVYFGDIYMLSPSSGYQDYIYNSRGIYPPPFEKSNVGIILSPSRKKLLLYKQNPDNNNVIFKQFNYETNTLEWNQSVDIQSLQKDCSLNTVVFNDYDNVLLEIKYKCPNDKYSECLSHYFLNGKSNKLKPIEINLGSNEVSFNHKLFLDIEGNFMISCYTRNYLDEKKPTGWPCENLMILKLDKISTNEIFQKKNSMSRYYIETKAEQKDAKPLTILYTKGLENGNTLVISNKQYTYYVPNQGTYYLYMDIIVTCYDNNGNELYFARSGRYSNSVSRFDHLVFLERDGHVVALFNEPDSYTAHFNTIESKREKLKRVLMDDEKRNTQFVAVVFDNQGNVSKHIPLRDNDIEKSSPLVIYTEIFPMVFLDYDNKVNYVQYLHPHDYSLSQSKAMKRVGAIRVQF